MKNLTIEINGVKYTPKFGYLCFLLLSKHWDLGEGVAKVFEAVGAGVRGDNMDDLVDIVWASLVTSKEPDGSALTVQDAGIWLFDNLDKITDLQKAIVGSLAPPADEAGKPQALPEATSQPA